jgi:uncharacterized protein with NAD-binding domain and iron-sulfur cluster
MMTAMANPGAGSTRKIEVAVIGGGLAGMIAALRLLERGCAVTIYEAGERLGGKAGAGIGAEVGDDHGYHIFPAWYRNIWALVDELKIRDRFVDCAEFWQMRPGAGPKSFRNLSSWKYAWHNLRSGVLPPAQAFLFFYAALDLMSQPYSYRAQLDRVTVSGFLRARSYRTERISSQFEELMLKGISVPTYQVSAMTMRNAMRYWFRYPEPMHRILDGSLQELWIGAIEQRLRELGGTIELRHALQRLVIEDGRLARLQLATRAGEARTVEVDRAVLAIPCEKVWPLLDDATIAAVPTLARTRYLRATPMAALNLYLDRPLESLPKGHVNLIDSAYGLSFIDVARYWKGAPGAALQVIASDFTALLDASPAYAERCVIEELKRCVPQLREATVLRANFLPHLDEPLFMNDVGAWSYRPDARTELHNLYVAGDYCRSAIDLVSMEGAVSTGLLAAEAVRADAELPHEVEILVPETPPRWLLVLGRVTLLPLALLAKLWTLVTDRGEGGDAAGGEQRQRRQHQAQGGLDEQRAGGGEKGERSGAAGGAAQAQGALDGGAGGLQQKEGEHREPNPKARSR